MKRSWMQNPSRRECLGLMAFASAAQFPSKKEQEAETPPDWTCPMDPDVHLDHPGKCPRCGMTLVAKVPDPVEYVMTLAVEPRRLQPHGEATLTFRVADPSGHPVRSFEIVHEKLIHLFIVSEDLEFFAHEHPVMQDDYSFTLRVRLPKPGMYRLLADYYPSGATPQLTVKTLYVPGPSPGAHLERSNNILSGENLAASIRLEPENLLAGLQSRLFYDLHPGEGIERYLGAWGHMLIVSEDLVDLMHLHPFLASSSTIQYNVIFPRPVRYRVWSQFQRLSIVNTMAYTVRVGEI